MKDLANDQKVGLVFRVMFLDKSIKSYSFLQTFDKTSFDDLYHSLEGFLELRSDDYKDEIVISFIFSYFLYSNKNVKNKIIDVNKNNVETINKGIIKIKKNYFKFHGFNIPISSDFNQWGTIIREENNYIMIAKRWSHLTYHIYKYDDRNEIIIKKDDKELLNFIDRKITNNTNYDLIRTFKNQEFHFNKGKLVVKEQLIKTSLMKSKKVIKKNHNNFITCDIETTEVNNKLMPVCFSIYDGFKCKSFYLSDFNTHTDMLLESIRYLLQTKYKYNIYFHNLSLFDGVFLFSLLSEIPNSKLDIIKKDNKFIALKLKWNTSIKNINNVNDEYSIILILEIHIYYCLVHWEN